MAGVPVVVGVEHGQAGVALRERLVFADAALADGLRVLSGYVAEGAILSTCGRTEIYALAPGPDPLRRFLADNGAVPLAEIERASFAHVGPAAVRHACRVAAGLESVVLGEPQILGQLRTALAAAQAAATAGPVVARLLTEALRAGKCARSETGIARNRLSLPHAALDLAAGRLGASGLRGQAAVVVGAGEMAALAAKLLRAAGVGDLVVANRTEPRASSLAAKVGGRSVPLADLPAALAAADLVVSAAACPAGHLIDRQTLRHRPADRPAPLVAIDLAVPRSIDPALAADPRLSLAGVDDLAAVAADLRRGYEGEIVQAEAIVERAVAEFDAWLAARAAAPTIADLRRRAEAIRAEELDATLRKLAHLSPRDRNLVAALSTALTNTLLHAPIAALRRHLDDDLDRATRLLFALDPPTDRQPPSDLAAD